MRILSALILLALSASPDAETELPSGVQSALELRQIPSETLSIHVADVETGEEHWVDTDHPGWAKHVREDAARFEEEIRSIMRKCNTDRIKLVAGDSFVLSLGQFFKRRASKFVWA